MSYRVPLRAAAVVLGASILASPSALAQGAVAAPAQEEPAAPALGVGSEAPSLDVAHWLKGEEVTEFEEGKVYVVEFWATWCGPCKASMPHISKLQEEYKDYDVRFIGISDEKLQTVFNFLKQEEWDGKTQYSIATDPDRSVFSAYMTASGQNGIPTAFVVGKSGNIEFIGHPIELDGVIAKVVHGEWDPETYAAEQESAMALRRAVGQLQNEATYAQAMETIQKNLDSIWNDANTLNTVSWRIMTDPGIVKRDLDFAMKLAERASELTEHKSGMILDTLARAHYEKGDLAKAIEIQKKAVEFAEPEFAEQIKETLAQFEKEAAGG